MRKSKPLCNLKNNFFCNGVEIMPDEKERKFAIERAMWRHCPTHNIDYPANETCPQCSRGRTRATGRQRATSKEKSRREEVKLEKAWCHCSRHNIDYPCSEGCPKCEG